MGGLTYVHQDDDMINLLPEDIGSRQVFDEIQRSNMSKLSEDGTPIYRDDGKILKGPNYFKPRIAEILNR